MRCRRRVTVLHVYAGLILAFLFAPLAVMALYSFHGSAALGLPFRGFSLQWFEKVIDDPDMRRAIRNSVQLSLVAGAAVTVLGTLAALATARYRFPGRGLMRVLIIAPILIPGLLYSISLLSFFSQRGVTLSLWTVALGHTVILLPVFYLVVDSRLARFDPALEEAARDLGATSWQSFRRVVFPIIAPSILAAALLTVASSWDELPVALFNAGVHNTVPLLIYTRIRVIVEPTINAIAVLLLAATVLLMVFARRILHELQR